jgi:hypothetical protein
VVLVGRLSWSQLRHRTARSLALLLGMLVATTAFTVLTSASRTAQLRTIGTVSAHFASAYNILVRPAGSRTKLEASTGTVQPNFLSGIYGGITMGQYHRIQAIPGVQVAAPIAMVGYTIMSQSPVTVRLPAGAAAGTDRQLYRYTTTWVSAGGSSRVTGPPSYVYVTPNRFKTSPDSGQSSEVLPGGQQAKVCDGPPTRLVNPFGLAAQVYLYCWSRANGMGEPTDYPNLSRHHPGFGVSWTFPMLIAAVDPVAEAKLDDLSGAVTAGHYLRESAGTGIFPGSQFTTFPVLAASTSGVGEYAVTKLVRLPDPGQPPVLNLAGIRRESAVPGRAVLTVRTTAQEAYQRLLGNLTKRRDVSAVFQYWNDGSTTYRRATDGSLTPVIVRNPLSVWKSKLSSGGVVHAPMDNADHQFRVLRDHDYTAQDVSSIAIPRVVGTFSRSRIRAFDALTEVPLGGYEPTAAAPADAAARKALGGKDLQPDLNVGGYVSQPAQLITTLKALPALENNLFSGHIPVSDPISVIRVRVAGVTGPNSVSLARIREVAQQIDLRTHLDVDIVAGSSPAPTTIDLPAGRFGQPALRLTEGWVKKGVAVAILRAVDRKSIVLFVLILVVCALFVANSATAAVRGRRQELGVLACLGWTRPRLFGTVLGELAAIGLVAGVLGGLLSLPLSAALHLHVTVGRAVLAIPAAMILAIAAGAVPAWLASRASPAVSVRPPVLAVRRGRTAAGITGLAWINVRRTPGRTILGAFSLAVGVAALTMITAVTLAFHGTVVGSLLGDGVAVQVRSVDYIAVTATIALGVLAVADVLFLNIRERGAEIATIRTFGWREGVLGRLVVTEGALIGVAGSVAGAALGLAGTAEFAGQFPARLWAVAGAAAAAGILVTVVAALIPAQLLRRLPTAHLLAEE